MAYPIANVLITAMSLQVRDLAKDLFLLTNLLDLYKLSPDTLMDEVC